VVGSEGDVAAFKDYTMSADEAAAAAAAPAAAPVSAAQPAAAPAAVAPSAASYPQHSVGTQLCHLMSAVFATVQGRRTWGAGEAHPDRAC